MDVEIDELWPTCVADTPFVSESLSWWLMTNDFNNGWWCLIIVSNDEKELKAITHGYWCYMTAYIRFADDHIHGSSRWRAITIELST